MNNIFLILFWGFVNAGTFSESISNGHLPFLIKIYYNNNFQCLGTLYNGDYLITAGECVNKDIYDYKIISAKSVNKIYEAKILEIYYQKAELRKLDSQLAVVKLQQLTKNDELVSNEFKFMLNLDESMVSLKDNHRLVMIDWTNRFDPSKIDIIRHDALVKSPAECMADFKINLNKKFCIKPYVSNFVPHIGSPVIVYSSSGWLLVGIVSKSPNEQYLGSMVLFRIFTIKKWIDNVINNHQNDR